MYDAESSYNATEPHDLLIRTPKLGQDLANIFLTSENASSSPPVTDPDCSVVLMRRHGFTTAAVDIQTAVFQAIFNQYNAQAQTTAVLLRGAFDSLSEDEARAWRGETNNIGKGSFAPLTPQQAQGGEISIGATTDRPWGLWLKEVENNSRYTNNVQL